MNVPLPQYWYDLNAARPLPRIVEVDPRVLPKQWADFCLENKIRLFAVIGYENEAGNIKIWPAGNIIARAIERGEHLKTDTIIESTSGNFGEGLAKILDQLLERDPTFPIKRVIAVIPRSLQPGKQARLRAHKCIELEFADNAAEAMKLAEALARVHGYLYTRQYWNTDNSAIYKKIGAHVAHQLPDLGIWGGGVGSGGTFAGSVEEMRRVFKDRTLPKRLHCIAVAVKLGDSVGGVRTEIGLQLNPLEGRPGLPWRTFADDVNYIGLSTSLKFSATLWRQHPNDPERRISAGESTGFALAGTLLGARSLEFMDDLDLVRNEAGEVIMAFPAPDTYEPYRKDYEYHGISLPN